MNTTTNHKTVVVGLDRTPGNPEFAGLVAIPLTPR